MPVRCVVKPGAYFDSVTLMRVAADVAARPGVRNASLVMATDSNRDVLARAGLLDSAAEQAGPNDLVIAIDADDAELEGALAAAEAGLDRRRDAGAAPGAAAGPRLRTLAQAAPADLALISTPGRYAAAEALKALRLGMSVFLFSDNVPLDQEVMLKRAAHERGLLVMGPDCGTCIIGGAPLGFANVVRPGEIGLVGASGTGLQQICTLVDRWGAGTSQVIGVGGRDLSAEVGGTSMLDALDALAEDPGTRAVVLVSKPPDGAVAEAVLARAGAIGKPVVACFLGAVPDAPDGVAVVRTLEEAARAAVLAVGGRVEEPAPAPDVAGLAGERGPERRLLRALYSGGTFAYEARLLLEPRLGPLSDDVEAPVPGRATKLPDEHLVLDLGDDRFTVGRPHPMIDPEARLAMLRAVGADPRTAAVVLDIVIGHGAAADPAGALAPAIAELTAVPGGPVVVAFVVGTAADPQGLVEQEATLRGAGAVLAASSSAAAALVGTLVDARVGAA